MMSATMLPKVIACKLLGLDINDVDYKEMDSPIPVTNRPIIYKPTKKLKYGASADEVYEEVKKTIEQYKGVKGIIHGVSYTRAKTIARLSNRCITHDTYDKNEKIRQFINSKDGILVSPSCERGLDLRGDLARFNIIPKIPFPSLADKVVSKRLYSKPFGDRWYRAITGESVVQGVGKTTRRSGFLATYMADKCFQQCDEYKCGEVDCAYEDAKKTALQSTFTTLNMHYYATETNFVGRFSKRKTVIIDEADVLEDVLIDFIALDIHLKTLEKFKLDQPKYVTKLGSWKEWADKALKILGEKVIKLKAAEDHLGKESKLELNKLSRMCLKLHMLKTDITEDWIFDHTDKFRFQPLWLDTKLTQQYLLKHAVRFIAMSATMLPKVIACKLLGLELTMLNIKK